MNIRDGSDPESSQSTNDPSLEIQSTNALQSGKIDYP
jgi:hypothetical protein